MADEVRFTISEVTFSSGRQSTILVDIDGVRVKIPVPAELRAYFDAQFVRSNPSTIQRKKYGTLMQLIKAAYKAGRHDGANAAK